MSAAALPFDVVPDPAPASQARSLHAWNVRLSAIDALQAVPILAISLARSPMVAAPVVRAHLLFSLIAKSLLAWQGFAGTLRP